MQCARGLSLVSAVGALACGSPSSATPPSSCRADALVAASNYDVASGVGNLALDGTGYLAAGVNLGGDPALETSAGRAFYIARDLGFIYELTPDCGIPFPDGGGTHDVNRDAGSLDPQDVAAAPDGTLWVPLYLTPAVIAIGPTGAITHTVNLSPYAYGGSGNPDATAIAIVNVDGGAKAFVALEMLDNAAPMPKPYPNTPSLILPIDTATGIAETPIELQGRNPFGLFVPYGGALWIAEPGDFSVSNETNAGIERFDPQTSTSQLVVRESEAGGSVAQVALTAECGAAIIADASAKNLTSLITFDPTSGAVLKNPVFGPTADYDLQAMLWVGRTLLVGDRSTAANGMYAVHVFDLTAPCSLRERPDSIFLPWGPVALQPRVP